MVAVNDHLLSVKVASYVRLNADLSSLRLCNLYDYCLFAYASMYACSILLVETDIVNLVSLNL